MNSILSFQGRNRVKTDESPAIHNTSKFCHIDIKMPLNYDRTVSFIKSLFDKNSGVICKDNCDRLDVETAEPTDEFEKEVETLKRMIYHTKQFYKGKGVKVHSVIAILRFIEKPSELYLLKASNNSFKLEPLLNNLKHQTEEFKTKSVFKIEYPEDTWKAKIGFVMNYEGEIDMEKFKTILLRNMLNVR